MREAEIWKFLQEIYLEHKSRRGFVFLKDISMVSVDNFYLINCYSNERTLSFKISVDNNFLSGPTYKISNVLSGPTYGHRGEVLGSQEEIAEFVHNFMIPMIRDFKLGKMGVN